MLCKKTGSISLLNAGFQQLVTLLKLMDYHWHKIKAFLWLVESSAEFSEQILYLSMQHRNREWNVCASSTWKPFLPFFYPWVLWIPGMGTEAPPASGSALVPPFPSTGIPPAAAEYCCTVFTLQEQRPFQYLTGKVAWGSQRHLFAYAVKPTRPMEIVWATLSAVCSHRQNYKHIRVSFCSSEGKLPHVYVLLISSSFLSAICWHADSKRKTCFPSCYTLVELSPKCKTKIRMQGHS